MWNGKKKVNTVKNMYNCSFGFTSTYINSFVKSKCDKCYFIGKFFEIPGSGLLLLADISFPFIIKQISPQNLQSNKNMQISLGDRIIYNKRLLFLFIL
jgi:hypothetical protein